MRLFLLSFAVLASACGSESDPAVPSPISDVPATAESEPGIEMVETEPEADGAEAARATKAAWTSARRDAAGGPATGFADWTGRYAYREGGGVYTYRYELALETAGPEAPDQYVGTLDVEGPQVTKLYEVLGEPTDGGLSVVLIGFREGNANQLTAPGTELFELRWEDAGGLGDEIGDRVLKTYWGALTPTGAGDSSIDAEWSLAFVPGA